MESYADGVSRSDIDLLASIFAEDCSWEFAGRPIPRIEGKAKLVETLRGTGRAYPNMALVAVPAAIHVTGDTATARAVMVEIFEDPETGRTRHGRPTYHDTYVKRDGRRLLRTRISEARHYPD